MKQVAKIKLDEQGAEAAAVTIIDVAGGIPDYATFHANRPFLYIISEQSTGSFHFPPMLSRAPCRAHAGAQGQSCC